MATFPPGRAARIISSMPRAVSRTLRRPKATLTTPKVSLGTGSRWVSPSISVTRPSTPSFRTLAWPRTSISRQKSVPTTATFPLAARSYSRARSAVPVQQSSTGTPGCGGTVRVVNRRHERSMFRLRRWFKKSYRLAIEANIRLTRRSDLSVLSVDGTVAAAGSAPAGGSGSRVACGMVARTLSFRVMESLGEETQAREGMLCVSVSGPSQSGTQGFLDPLRGRDLKTRTR